MLVGAVTRIRPSGVLGVRGVRIPALVRFASKASSSSGDTSKADAKQLAAQRERAAKRESAKRAEARKVARMKDIAREAFKSPLCLDIETALRYLRAAEVGKPAKSTTITVNLGVVAEKGAALLQGTYRLARPLDEQRIAVFTTDREVEAAAKQAGASIVGSDDLIAKIRDGIIEFDRAYATPDMMGRLNTVARTLGPLGLMPSAKRGTVVPGQQIAEVISAAAGETVFKQKNSVLSLPVGRADFSDAEIIRNIITVTDAVRANIASMDSKKAPSLGLTTLTSTTGPAIVVQL